jgi:hypothetical protein
MSLCAKANHARSIREQRSVLRIIDIGLGKRVNRAVGYPVRRLKLGSRDTKLSTKGRKYITRSRSRYRRNWLAGPIVIARVNSDYNEVFKEGDMNGQVSGP